MNELRLETLRSKYVELKQLEDELGGTFMEKSKGSGRARKDFVDLVFGSNYLGDPDFFRAYSAQIASEIVPESDIRLFKPEDTRFGHGRRYFKYQSDPRYQAISVGLCAGEYMEPGNLFLHLSEPQKGNHEKVFYASYGNDTPSGRDETIFPPIMLPGNITVKHWGRAVLNLVEKKKLCSLPAEKSSDVFPKFYEDLVYATKQAILSIEGRMIELNRQNQYLSKVDEESRQLLNQVEKMRALAES